MKRATSISIVLLLAFTTYAQISIHRSQGGSMKFDGIISPINKGSTLVREYITLNDQNCPLLINHDVGVKPRFKSDIGFWFTARGNIHPLQPIVAYEIHHILYDVFGQHIISLSNVEITDFDSPRSIERDVVFERFQAWHTLDYEAMVYCYCVSYVATVRTKDGEIWKYDPSAIMSELNTNEIPYEEEYSPTHQRDDKDLISFIPPAN